MGSTTENNMQKLQMELQKRQHRGFFQPVEKKLSTPILCHCEHCRSDFNCSSATLFHWQDRYPEDCGWVVNCPTCGSRMQLDLTTKKEEISTPPKKPKYWVGVLVLLAILAVICATAIPKVLQNDLPPDVIRPSETNVSEDTSTLDTLIQPLTLSAVGNSYINISEGGVMVVVDNYVYYTNPADNYSICRMDLNFENIEQICDIPSFYLNYYDGKLYFAKNCDGREMYRVDLDGSNLEQLNNQATYEPKIVDNYIYFEDIDDDYSLWRCNLDGSELTYLSEGIVFYCCVADNKIYYIDTWDNRKCYVMDLDGSNKEVLFSDSCRTLAVYDNKLYLSMTEGGIYTYDLSDGTTNQVSSIDAMSVNVSDGWIYFANGENDRRLYKMTVDGEDLTKLTNDPVEFINVYSNLISYREYDTENFYWCLTDSSHNCEIG